MTISAPPASSSYRSGDPAGTLAAPIKDAATHLDTTVDDVLSKIR